MSSPQRIQQLTSQLLRAGHPAVVAVVGAELQKAIQVYVEGIKERATVPASALAEGETLQN